jgi:hypothetical protein
MTVELAWSLNSELSDKKVSFEIGRLHFVNLQTEVLLFEKRDVTFAIS